MATTKNEIRGWLDRAKKEKATHLIVVCDTYDHEDYPVFVSEKDDVQRSILDHSINMQRVMEVYSMKMDLESQLAETRAYHPDHK